MDENLDAFLEQLLVDKGMTALSGEVREEVKLGMADRLMDEIDKSILDALPEEKAKELDQLLDDENFGQREMIDFVSNSGLNIVNIVAVTMARFRSFYLADSIREMSREIDAEDAVDTEAAADVADAAAANNESEAVTDTDSAGQVLQQVFNVRNAQDAQESQAVQNVESFGQAGAGATEANMNEGATEF